MRLKNRNLMNIDCNCYFYSPKVWQPEGKFGREGIHNFVKTTAENGIDTLVVNPSAQLLWMPSKRGNEYVHEGYTRGDTSKFAANAACEGIKEEDLPAYYERLTNLHDRYLDLLEQGINWFEETEKACRKYGVSPWISIRMNDTHGGSNPAAGFFGNARIFNEDPTIRLNKPSIHPWRENCRYALDYSQQRVRDHMFRIMEECVEEYGYEGMELDFLRDPIFLQPVVSREMTEIMTDWIGEIRRLTRKKALKTGRPFLLGVRCPGHLNLMRDMGLDVRELVKRNLIDFVGVSNYWQTSWDMDYAELRRELGDGITLYGVVEGGLNWLKTKAADSATLKGFTDFYNNTGDRLMQYEKEAIIGNAAGKLVMGADGIEQFNNFYSWDTKRFPMEPSYDALKYLYDLDYLRGKEKHYCLSTQDKNPYTTVPYETVETLPETIKPECRRGFRIPMCKEPLDQGLRLIVQVICEKKEEELKVGISFNNNWPDFKGEKTTKLLFPCGIYTDVRDEHVAYNFEVDLSLLRDGYNQICVFNGEQQSSDRAQMLRDSIRVLSLEAAVKC